MKAAHRYFLVPLFLFPILFFTIPTGSGTGTASVAGDYGAVDGGGCGELHLSAARVWGDPAVPELERRGPG
jgi:hypothetical protein